MGNFAVLLKAWVKMTWKASQKMNKPTDSQASPKMNSQLTGTWNLEIQVFLKSIYALFVHSRI